jgi:hypothetical protein
MGRGCGLRAWAAGVGCGCGLRVWAAGVGCGRGLRAWAAGSGGSWGDWGVSGPVLGGTAGPSIP